MNRSALLMILPLLAGCSMHSKDHDNDNVSIQADESGHVEFNLPIIEGRVKLPSGMMSHSNIDIDGVKLMPGSSVTGFSVMAGDKVTNVDLAFSSPQSPEAVRSYYSDQFGKQGVDVASAGDSLTGKSKEGSAFSIQVTPAGSGSTGKIHIEDKD